MNKTTVKVGISFVIAAGMLATIGFLEWFAHENCMEMIRASERGESSVTPLCPADPQGRFFIVAMPVGAVGVVLVVMGIKDIVAIAIGQDRVRMNRTCQS